jgi:hypothetical protein
MKAKDMKVKKYENDVEELISLVTQRGLDPFRDERKTSMLYQLEAEEISLKNLGVSA